MSKFQKLYEEAKSKVQRVSLTPEQINKLPDNEKLIVNKLDVKTNRFFGKIDYTAKQVKEFIEDEKMIWDDKLNGFGENEALIRGRKHRAEIRAELGMDKAEDNEVYYKVRKKKGN